MTSTPASPTRLAALDGLRGFAAAVVLLHHLSMTIPAVSDGYDSSAHAPLWSVAWWLTETPLKFFVAGPEFVLVFFVLSGFVLTLAPLKRGRSYDWLGYYPRRIIRLGIPVVASMVLAVAVILLLPHPVVGDRGSWLTRQADPNTSAHNLVEETLLIVSPNRPSVNPPLWSLTWEMWFSLLLPVGVLIAIASRRMPPIVSLLLLTGISVAGYITGTDAAMYMPAFGLGAVLGANAKSIHAGIERVRHRRWFPVVAIVVCVAGPMLSISYWLLRAVIPHGAETLLAMRVPGALLIVAAVAFIPVAAWLFERRPLLAVGKVSFSLYLVHSPVVVAFGLMFIGSVWWIGAVSSILVSSALAIAMYVFVERPSQRLSSWFGRRTAPVLTSLPLLEDAPIRLRDEPVVRHGAPPRNIL